MLKDLLYLLLALAQAVKCIHLQQNHQAVSLAPVDVNLRADNGQYLQACFQCGNGIYDYSAGLGDYPQVWSMEVIGDKIAFKSATGKYLSRCLYCWKDGPLYDDAVFVHITTPSSNDPWALWIPERLSSGKFTFKSDDGNFLTRCERCVPQGNLNFAFVHRSNSDLSASQWDVTYSEQPPFGTQLKIIADNGNYLQFCNICGISDPNRIPAEVSPINYVNNPVWVIEQVGSKVALKSQGKYLSRCNSCWSKAAYPDAAFSSGDTTFGKWNAVRLLNGKWTFQSDTGKYLARCYACAYSQGNADFAFIHVTDPYSPYAQWTLSA